MRIGQLQQEVTQLRAQLARGPPRAPDVLVGSHLQQVVEPLPQVTRFLVTWITPMEGQVLQLLAMGHPERMWWVGVAYVALYACFLFFPMWLLQLLLSAARRRQ